MKILSNAHTHTTWCDGSAGAGEVVEAARKLGFVSLGFSGHAAQGFDDLYSMMGGRQEKYLSELRELQLEAAKAARLPRLWIGLELDAMSDAAYRRDAYARFDYVIGSAHYLSRDFAGACVAADGDPSLLARYVKEAFDGDGLATARAYFNIEVDALLRDRPHIIGHFDLIRKYGKQLALFDESDRAYRKLALDALERAYPCGGVLEINTGGMARGDLDTPYPTEELLGAWREMGGRVTVTSDCHDAKRLEYAFDDAVRLAGRAGFTSVLRLGTGSELWEAVDIC